MQTYDNYQCKFLCETLDLSPTSDAVNLLTDLPDSEAIKTYGSESRGQEEAGLRDKRVSYLQVAPL